MTGSAAPIDLLRTCFGFDTFRPGQEAVITRLLSGESALAVFPTGAGKSLCYQLPALALDGVTLVVSPLIALMKDQVDALTMRDIPAARLDSSLEAAEVREVLGRLECGELKLLYVAPERLGNEGFLQRLRRTKIAMIAVDEAHCISEWGHNFRPDYLKVARLTRELSVPRALALTATATPKVSADILNEFGIPAEGHVQTGFHRPNLTLKVVPCGRDERPARLLEVLRRDPLGPTIVYVTYQRTSESIATYLKDQGLPAAAYHAGMKDGDRSRVQDAFMRDAVRVVVATIAFGMGIDKPDIRQVCHFNLPKTLENYAQEIGRAGRDGDPSVCTMLGCADDRLPLENFTFGDTPTPEALKALLADLLSRDDTFDVALHELSVRFDMRPLVVSTALTYLEIDEFIRGTGPFYAAYKAQFLEPEEELLARFDPARQEFLRRLFAAGTMGRKWLHLDPAAVAATTGDSRERIVSAITWLDEREYLQVEKAGWRHGYRWLRRPDPTETWDRLVALFQRREEQDLARIDGVVAFSESGDCLTRRLLGYFGEDLPDDCGTCTSCQERRGRTLPRSIRADLGPVEEDLARRLLDESKAALAHPRQVTRFLCGLASPATTRARLTKDARFGTLRDYPFKDVQALVEGVARS